MKVAVIVTDNFSAWNFRGNLLRASAQRGLDTYILTPSGQYDDSFKSLGATHIPIKVNRLVNPVVDISFVRQLYKILQAGEFDIVHNISIKPNIYGAIAAKFAKVPTVVGSVTGIGNVYIEEMGLRIRLLRPLVTQLYRLAFKVTDRVWFQNPDDVEFFVSSHMIAKDKVVLIRSSGVDVHEFSADQIDAKKIEQLKGELEIGDSTVVVSMVARTLTSKGVEEFVQASAIVGVNVPNIKFLLIGDGEEGNPQSVSREYLRSKHSDNFAWLGWRSDVKELLSISDIAVLLARYREGTPKSLLEAMAMSTPIVATDVPGCREVVDEGENGYLVPPKSAEAVADAVKKLALDAHLRTDFGIRSRKKVETEFDQEQVNHRILTELYQV